MSLYREIPKKSLISELKNNFTMEELDIIKNDILSVMSSSDNLNHLYKRLDKIVKEKSKSRH